MREIKVLFGTNVDSDCKKQVESINAKLEKCDMRITGWEERSTKTALLDYVGHGNTCDFVISSEYIDNVPLTSKDFERMYDDLGSKVPIIIISSIGRGDARLRDFISAGLYNLLLCNDGTLKNVVERMTQPLSKVEALSYYGVADRSDVGKSLVGGESRRTPEPVSFIGQATGSITDLNRRLVRIQSEMSPDEFQKILVELPVRTLEEAKTLERFASLAELALNKKSELAVKRGKDVQRETSKKKAPENERSTHAKINIKKIAFIGTSVGVGCTHQAVLCAYSLLKSGENMKVAIAELNKSGDFKRLGSAVANINELTTSFNAGGVEFIYNVPFKKIESDYSPRYDYVVFDCGALPADKIAGVVSHMDRAFVVASAAEYRLAELKPVADVINKAKMVRSFTVLFPLTKDYDLGGAREILGDNIYYASVDAETNMYSPSQKSISLFLDRVEASSKASDIKPITHERSVEDKLRDKTVKESIGHRALKYIAAAGVLLTVLVIVIIALIAKNSSTVKRAAQVINEYESVVAEKEQQIIRLTDELSEMDVLVFELIRPVAAGTQITEEMLKTDIIKTTLSKDSFAQKEDIVGKVAAINIGQDSPILDYYVATGNVKTIPNVLIEERIADEREMLPETEPETVAEERSEQEESSEEEEFAVEESSGTIEETEEETVKKAVKKESKKETVVVEDGNEEIYVEEE